MDKDFDPKYLVTLDEIYHAHWAAGKHQGIARFRQLIQDIWPQGHPTRMIHITGTNGKGSVACYLSQALATQGKTGSWTGPHVFDYAERFHINNEKVSHQEIAQIYHEKLRDIQQSHLQRHGDSLSFAELGILITLFLFERHEVDWGMMEVGAGGRYTPLMALDMAACVLTNVGEDHPKSLGHELWQRCLEKAGIARPGVPFFTAAQDEANFYVTEAARAEGAEIFEVGEAEFNEVAGLANQPQPQHALYNKALALRIAQHFYPDSDKSLLLEQMKARLTGRFQAAAGRQNGQIIIDVAHNPNKVARLAEELELTHPGKKFTFLLGLTRSRDVRQVFAALIPLAKKIYFTSASYAGQDPIALADQLRLDFAEVDVIQEPHAAYEQLLAQLGADDILVLTGSAYMIDQALNTNDYIRHTNRDYGRRARHQQGTEQSHNF